MFRSRTHTRTLPSSPGAASLQPLQGAHGTLLVAQLHKVLASPGTPRPCLFQPQHPQVLLKDGACQGRAQEFLMLRRGSLPAFPGYL